MIDITFLGTSCMQPTKERNHPSFFMGYGGEGLLFDCGEGTQRQLRLAGIRPPRITKILLTHWHGDHALGVPGLVNTLAADEYNGTLEIYGPEGTKEKLRKVLEVFAPKAHMEYAVTEVKEGNIFENDDFALFTAPMRHGVPCVGYAFVEKEKRKMDVKALKKLGIPQGPLWGRLQEGQAVTYKGMKITPEETTLLERGKKIVYITDTRPCDGIGKIAKDADVLILEATYKTGMEDKAEAYKHLTAKEAAMIAHEVQAKKLILTHFSQRYKNSREIEEDARQYFDDVIVAEDLLVVRV